MTGALPTRDGDVVITHRGTSAFDVWQVLQSGQAQPGPDTPTWMALGRPAALKLGRMMARASRGAVFVVEADGLTWTKLSD